MEIRVKHGEKAGAGVGEARRTGVELLNSVSHRPIKDGKE